MPLNQRYSIIHGDILVFMLGSTKIQLHIFCCRGCLKIIWTGLNIKIGIVQKVYVTVIKLSFCQNDPQLRLEKNFGKITAWSLIYFLRYAYFDV